MSNDLVKHDAPGLVKNAEDLARVSKMLADSGFFTDAKEAAQCGVKVLAGLEMGFGAFASMTGIHIVKGKPSVGAHLMAAAVKRSGKYDYRVTKMTDDAVTIDFYQAGERIGTSEFTKADATRAGTQNLDKFPRNMLFARAMSNGIRWFCPDVFDAPTYTPEELGATVDAEGDVIDVPSRPATQPEPEPAGESEPDEPEELLSSERAEAMAVELEKAGIPRERHAQLVAAVLGKRVDSLAELTPSEAVEVWTNAKRIKNQEAA